MWPKERLTFFFFFFCFVVLIIPAPVNHFILLTDPNIASRYFLDRASTSARHRLPRRTLTLSAVIITLSREGLIAAREVLIAAVTLIGRWLVYLLIVLTHVTAAALHAACIALPVCARGGVTTTAAAAIKATAFAATPELLTAVVLDVGLGVTALGITLAGLASRGNVPTSAVSCISVVSVPGPTAFCVCGQAGLWGHGEG